jgi:aryl-alcohol dehydrogenase-like predicted oxidoreductase
MRLEESKYNHLPRIKTVQNHILIEQTFENASSEVCMRENVGLLAYSPMAFGVLSGVFGENHPTRLNLSHKCQDTIARSVLKRLLVSRIA